MLGACRGNLSTCYIVSWGRAKWTLEDVGLLLGQYLLLRSVPGGVTCPSPRVPSLPTLSS